VVGVMPEANLALAKKLRNHLAKIPGIADVHLQQITDRPTLRLDVDRVMAAQLGLTQQNVANSVLVSLSSTSQVSPNFWVNPLNRVNYAVAVQTPPDRNASIDALVGTPIINGTASSAPAQQTGSGQTQAPQLLSNLVNLRRTDSEGLVSHYNVQTVFEVYARVQGRDLGSVSADV